jgi:hypothetical protein
MEHIAKADENLYISAFSGKYRITAIFDTDDAGNKYMELHPTESCIANFGPFVIIAENKRTK